MTLTDSVNAGSPQSFTWKKWRICEAQSNEVYQYTETLTYM